MWLVFAFALRGASGRERRWLLALLSFALGLRVLVLAIFFLFTYWSSSPPVMLPDEGYIARRATWLSRIALQQPLASAEYIDAFNPYAESAVLYLHAYLELLLGPSPYGIRLLSVALYLAAAVVLYRTVRPVFGAASSLAGLAILLFMPTAFVWSISALKEAPYYFLGAVGLAAAMTAVRTRTTFARIVAVVTCVASILIVPMVRSGGLAIVGGGIVLSLASAALIHRPRLLVAAIVGCYVLGAAVAQGGSWAQAQTMAFFRNTAVIHIGHVKTPGRAYKLLDPEFYTRQNRRTFESIEATNSMDGSDIARYVIRAAGSFVLVPLPWQLSSGPGLAYLPQQVVWYVIIAFALVGIGAGVRRDALLTLLLLATAAIAAAGISLTSGNIGTFVRHRDMTLMQLAWLSGVGAIATLRYVVAKWTSTSEPSRI
jgi:hypothetical protein